MHIDQCGLAHLRLIAGREPLLPNLQLGPTRFFINDSLLQDIPYPSTCSRRFLGLRWMKYYPNFQL